jgi:hypothetical protein
MKVKSKLNVNEHAEDESCNPHLSPNKIYNVVGFDYKCYRIIDDIGEPILYSKSLFNVVDPLYPHSWVREDYPDGDYYVDPPEFSAPGFYEAYFDGDVEAVERFTAYWKLHGL